MTALWHSAAPQRFRLHVWPDDGSGVLFDRASGDTHVIGVLGLLLIELVGDGPIDNAALRARALAQLESPDTLPEHAIDEALHGLQVIGVLARS